MSEIPHINLETGGEIPIIGFGTWNLGGAIKSSVRKALETGYRHIDTAEGYRNESAIGEVIQDYERGELFLTSKVVPSNLNYDNVLEACDQSLERLGTSYLDLYLIHWPNPAISLRETLHAFKKLYDTGKVRNIGVSNFSLYQLKVANKISEVPIAVDQIEFHPWYHDEDLLTFCRNNNIYLTASAPLARQAILKDSLINELADKYEKSPAQIVLRWQVQRNVITIPKSSSEEHINQNFSIFDFELDQSEMEDLKHIPKVEKSEGYSLDLDDSIYGIPS